MAQVKRELELPHIPQRRVHAWVPSSAHFRTAVSSSIFSINRSIVSSGASDVDRLAAARVRLPISLGGCGMRCRHERGGVRRLRARCGARHRSGIFQCSAHSTARVGCSK